MFKQFFCEVQRLYERGQRVRREVLAVPGELGFHKWRDGSNADSVRMRAELVGSNGDGRLPVLVDARVIKITVNGIVVVGTEVVSRTRSAKSNVEYYPQVWRCRLVPS